MSEWLLRNVNHTDSYSMWVLRNCQFSYLHIKLARSVCDFFRIARKLAWYLFQIFFCAVATTFQGQTNISVRPSPRVLSGLTQGITFEGLGSAYHAQRGLRINKQNERGCYHEQIRLWKPFSNHFGPRFVIFRWPLFFPQWQHWLFVGNTSRPCVSQDLPLYEKAANADWGKLQITWNHALLCMNFYVFVGGWRSLHDLQGKVCKVINHLLSNYCMYLGITGVLLQRRRFSLVFVAWPGTA